MAIMQGRQEKGWNQSEFAQRLCVKPDIVKSYENGTAVPDNNFIAKMERVLECKLPRHKKH
jgi:putative transcription factor